MKVYFFGGPLDGAVEEQGEAIRIFPDPTAPAEKVIVYTLISFPALRYHFDPILTAKANLKLKRERDVPS